MSDGVGTGNASWNQSLANTLYASIIWAYNQTYTSGTFNATYDGYNYSYGKFWINQTLNQTLFNLTFIQPYNIWFYNMSDGTGGNFTWNETRANLLYASIIWGYNQTYTGGTFNITYQNFAYNQFVIL